MDRRYDEEERAEINALLSSLKPGEWGDLGICYGGAECPYLSEEDAKAAGVAENFCPACRVIRVYRPNESAP